MLICCCELDNKIKNLCVKIQKNEKLYDLKSKIKNQIIFENLFFCKKDFGYFDEKEEEEIKIVDCLNKKKIVFSININLIIEIENEKFISEKLENLSLFELRNKLNNQINEQYKFYNDMGIILNENEINVFEIINKNKIKMKKIEDKYFNLIKEDELNIYNNIQLKNKNNNKIFIEENNKIENAKNDENLNDKNINDNFKYEMYDNNIYNENKNKFNNYENTINEENKEENKNEFRNNNLNNNFNFDNHNEMNESYEIIINGKKDKNFNLIKCKSSDYLNIIRKKFPKNFNNLVFLNGNFRISHTQEKNFKVNEILNDNKLYLKNENNEYNNNLNNLVLKNFITLGIDNEYKYYLYPNDKFNEEEERNCKSLLLVGESGVGKTTFINSLINFIMNVKYSDKNRFKIVNENNNNNNKEYLSQTKEVNVYYIKSQNGYPPIKIIDTPGFGDTQGIEHDKKIMSMIYDKFKTINELTSVCIISKSNNERFTFFEKYIYYNIIKLFAKDLISNFIFLFTFCDNQEPSSLQKFNDPNCFLYNIKNQIKDPWYLKFNNSGFFPKVQNKFSERFFELGIDSFKKLIIKLRPLKKCSLNLSNEINEKRIKLDELYSKIKYNLINLNNKNTKYKYSYNNNNHIILTNEEKKQIYIDFYNLEKYIKNYNNISIKESQENLKEFLDNLIEENKLNKTTIDDILKNYYDKKKSFLIDKNYYTNFENYLNNYNI